MITLLNGCSYEDEGAEEERIKLQKYLEKMGYSNLEPTNSGLYHIVLEESDGETPELSDYVNIKFTGKLVDGKVFDTSDRDSAVVHGILRDDKIYGPTRFLLVTLGFPGLREGLTLVKEGGKSRIIIPSYLAYGATDYGIIPPYSTLIYDVELLDVISDPVSHEQELLDAFIEQNQITAEPTGSGLYFIEEVQGTGDIPADNQSVTLHYKGLFLDGRVFDESESDKPLVIQMNTSSIIPGFIEGVKMMRQGGKARLIIPWDKGYGSSGSSNGVIPPYSTVIFDIEIVSIQ